MHTRCCTLGRDTSLFLFPSKFTNLPRWHYPLLIIVRPSTEILLSIKYKKRCCSSLSLQNISPSYTTLLNQQNGLTAEHLPQVCMWYNSMFCHWKLCQWKKGCVGVAVAIYANRVKLTACFTTLLLTYSFNDAHQQSSHKCTLPQLKHWNKFPAFLKWAYPGYIIQRTTWLW